MKWWRFAILAAVLIVTIGNTGPDDACVRKTIEGYGDGFDQFAKQFNEAAPSLNLPLLNLADRSARAQTGKDKDKDSSELKTRPEFRIRPAIPKEKHDVGITSLGGQHMPTSFEHSGEKINVLSYETNCKMPPFEIIKDKPYILDYPPPFPAYCPSYSRTPTPDPHRPKQADLPGLDKVLDFTHSVGRLKVQSTDDKGQVIQVELWGTGFMVGTKTFATSCHVIAPFLKNVKGVPELDKDKLNDNHEQLLVNFDASDVPLKDQVNFVVSGLAKCSSHDGLDIALLVVDPSKRPLPRPLALFYGTIRDLKRANERKRKEENFWRIGVLIGYGDLLHPIDETTSEMYRPYANDGYSDVKVAMLDGIIAEDECDDDLGIILDTVDTTVGESGSIVMDSIDWVDPKSPAFVLGVHTCCSTYFGLAKYTVPQSDLRCARLNRTFHNQDISSRSILRDRALCPIIRDDNGQMVDVQGDSPKPVSCSDLKLEWLLSWKTFYK